MSRQDQVKTETCWGEIRSRPRRVGARPGQDQTPVGARLGQDPDVSGRDQGKTETCRGETR